MEFKKGDTVKIKGTSSVGSIIEVRVTERTIYTYEELIGVEFAEGIPQGHSCRGLGIDGNCRWFKPWELTYSTK